MSSRLCRLKIAGCCDSPDLCHPKRSSGADRARYFYSTLMGLEIAAGQGRIASCLGLRDSVFCLSPAVRKRIDTTHAIENINSQLRKTSKSWSTSRAMMRQRHVLGCRCATSMPLGPCRSGLEHSHEPIPYLLRGSFRSTFWMNSSPL